MPRIEFFYDEIDSARIRRARELSELKTSFHLASTSGNLSIASKSVIMLAYANWEGFYNECVRSYLKFLVEKGGRVRDQDWMLLVGVFHADLESMRSRNHSLSSRQEFVSKLQNSINAGFDAVEVTAVEARSNLDFSRLSENFALLNLDLSPIQRLRIRLDKELVSWRHEVAHGDSPDLSQLNANSHVDFASKLILTISDQFQEAMLARM